MYRSSTGDFLLSLTPFKSFEDEYLRNRNLTNLYNGYFYSTKDFMDKDLWTPPICYNNCNNTSLKQILYNAKESMLNNNYFRYGTRVSQFKVLYDQYSNIKDLLDRYNLKSKIFDMDTQKIERLLMGVCLYKVNLDNFKITKYKYIHTMGLLYDILTSYENCNYFIKIIDIHEISYIFVDKLMINSFINILYLQSSSYCLDDYYKLIIITLITLYYLLSYQLKYQKFLFDKITNDFEIIRNEFKKNRSTTILQINLEEARMQMLQIKLRENIINQYNNMLKYFVTNTTKNNYSKRTKLIRTENYKIDSILKRSEIKSRHIYKDLIVYEKEVSYHIHDWMFLLNTYLYYNQVVNPAGCKSIRSLSKLDETKITILFNSLKSYEKSKYFIIKNNVAEKVLDNGIAF